MKTKLLLAFMILILVSSFGFAVLNDSEVYYSFDDTDLSGSNPLDISGNSRTGTNNGATTGVLGVIREAFDFELTESDYVYRNDANLETIARGTYSVSVWIKPESMASGTQCPNGNAIVVLGDDTNHLNNYLCMYNNSGTEYISINRQEQNVANNEFPYAFDPPTNEFTHLVMVYNSGTNLHSLYINGNSVINGTTSGNGASGTVSYGLEIGSGNKGTSSFFDGVIDDVNLYSRVLTHEEILELYNSGDGYNPFNPLSTDSYFSINVTNEDDYNLTINGTTYPSTAGIVTTTILNNDSNLWDFNITSNGYIIKTYNDYNVSSNLTTTIDTAFSVFVQNKNSFNLTLNGTTYTTTTGEIQTNIANNDLSLWDFDITSYGYAPLSYSDYNVSSNLTINLSTAFALNITNMNNFNVTLDSGVYSTTSGFLITNVSNDAGLKNFTILDTDDSRSYTVLNYDLATNYTNTKALLNVTAYDVIDDVMVQNFTVNLTADAFTSSDAVTNGFKEYYLLAGFEYDLLIDSEDYLLANTTLTLSTSGNNSNITLIKGQTLNITFYDEESLLIMNFTTVSLEVIGDVDAVNSTTTTGNIFVDTLYPGDYQLIYNADGYDQRIYYLTVNYREIESLTLYLLNTTTSDEVTVTVIDQYGDNVEGALVKLLKYNLSTNSYVFQQSFISNFEGQGVVDIILNANFYKFIVEVPIGTTVKETTGSYIFSTSLTLPVNLLDDVIADFNRDLNIDYNVTYNNVTGNARFAYNDLQGTAIGACLELYAVTLSKEILVNTSCTTGATGVILLPVYNGTYDFFSAKGYINLTSSDYQFLGSAFISFQETKRTETNFFIYDILITITIFMLLIFSPAIAVASLPFTTFIFTAVGFLNLDIGSVIGIQLVFIIVGMILGRRG